MTRRDEGMVDVELVVDQPSDGALAPGPLPAWPPGEPSAPTDGAAARRRPWWLSRIGAATAAAVIASFVGVSLGSAAVERAEVRRDDERVAALSHVLGVGPSLREPPTERWRMVAAESTLLGDVVLAHAVVDGALRTVARDAHSGRSLWTPAAELETGGPLQCTDELSAGALLLCLVPGLQGEPAPNTDALLGGTPDALVVLEASTGAVREQLQIGTGAIGWGVLGDDVVLGTRDGTVLTIERTRGLRGEVVWSSTVAAPPEVRTRHLDLRVEDGLAVVTGRMAAVVDGQDGAVLGTWSATDRGRVPVEVLTSSIGFAVWPSPVQGTWFNRAGQAGATLRGAPLDALVDDGSAPQLLLVQDEGRLRAVDVHRGVLWERDAVHGLPLRLDGLAVVVDDGVLRTIDLATGEELWSARPGIGTVLMPLVTDGVRVLVPGYEVATGRHVTAHDLRDGATLWTMPLPQRVSSVWSGNGLLVEFGNEIAVFD